MALFLRIGHRLARIGVQNGGRIGRPLVAGIHFESRKLAGGWDDPPPEGYDHTFLPSNELPEFLPDGELTPEKRAQLAAKYNLRPEDYKPLHNAGDYPDLPFEGVVERDPHYDWDVPSLRRNYGEPVHYEIDILHRISPMDRKPYIIDFYQLLRVYAIGIAVFVTLFYIGEQFQLYKPISPKQYPEWYPEDGRFTGNQETPIWKDMNRRQAVNYDFPSSGDHH